MENNQTVQGHSSLFLFPFFLESSLPSLTEKIAASPLWRRQTIPLSSSEALYFPSAAHPVLFENVYTLHKPHDFRLSFADHPLTLHDCRLYFWREQIGCLVLDLGLAPNHGGSKTASFAKLLDFNESFRYIGDLYEGHRQRRSALQVSYQGQDILVARRVEEFLACLLWENTIPAFDQRLVVFSFARLAEEPPPEWVYKFFNIDSSGYDIPDKRHVRHFLRHHVYQRWQAAGTLYGFTHYSGGCLACSRQPSSSEFSQDWLLSQFRTIYLDLALLLLFQLTTLRQVDRRLTALDLYDRVEFTTILADLTRFIRDYWFLRVSDQDQGRELFRMWRDLWEKDYRLMETVERKLDVLGRWFREAR